MSLHLHIRYMINRLKAIRPEPVEDSLRWL